jgi:hypothetical protein
MAPHTRVHAVIYWWNGCWAIDCRRNQDHAVIAGDPYAERWPVLPRTIFQLARDGDTGAFPAS